MESSYQTPQSPSEKPASIHDSARGSPIPEDAFQNLVQDINDILGPSNGIDSDGVDVDELKRVMFDYPSTESEWSKYAFADHSRAYTRNLVDRGNGKSNLVSKRFECQPSHARNHHIAAVHAAARRAGSVEFKLPIYFGACVSDLLDIPGRPGQL